MRKINGRAATDLIKDRAWLEGEFISTVQQRGAAVIKARGSSSAASAANAIVDSVRSIIEPTAPGDWHSVCVCSNGSYGIEQGLICSFPDSQQWRESLKSSKAFRSTNSAARRSTRR
jgi:malate dehydrogenase